MIFQRVRKLEIRIGTTDNRYYELAQNVAKLQRELSESHTISMNLHKALVEAMGFQVVPGTWQPPRYVKKGKQRTRKP